MNLTNYKIFPLLALGWGVGAGVLTILGHAFEAIPIALVSITLAILSQSEE